MVGAFSAVVDMPIFWRQAFPSTEALSGDCEKAPLEPHATHEPG